ncbi:Methyltransferase-like protein 13 [Heracleum sosnowskyi]|uniref:Methyltransferase-like protein 13 n=1 Tax=Heracleum sosnowskyi TaxID=360622 RepID=A0AAD8IIC1_9APIA|nr:Methyltransferase-like protein 13 [Heracleum sosnowskyi]
MSSTQAYGEEWYWDKRYEQESGPFDWYQKYSSLSPLLHLYIPQSTTTSLLVVGCGTSAFSESMVDDGYENVVNIDISSVAIQTMRQRYSNRPQLKYIKMDVRDMSAFQSDSFVAVIDKGTLDSLLCGHKSRENAAKMLVEVDRVLKANGVYILVTYGAPNYRLHLLREGHSWSIKLHVIGKAFLEASSEHQAQELTSPVPLNDETSLTAGKTPDVHYIYVCIKDDSRVRLGSKLSNP